MRVVPLRTQCRGAMPDPGFRLRSIRATERSQLSNSCARLIRVSASRRFWFPLMDGPGQPAAECDDIKIKEVKRYAPFAGIMSRPSVALWTRSRSVRRSARR